MGIDPSNTLGIVYLSLGWGFNLIIYIVIAIRMYSRTVLTRSVGSDDFALLVSVCLTTIGNTGDTIGVINGVGMHENTLTQQNLNEVNKWLQIDWIIVFISFGFVRASVMLFVLRLLPTYKRWQKNAIIAAFILNIIVVLIGTVSYGLSCMPFEAWYKPVPGAKCFSKHNLVITNQINGALSCVIDVTVAIVPQVLLWGVQMKKKTKRILNLIFSLGLITSALSIARIATINDNVEAADTTYRTIPTSTCSLVEEKMGILCACGPAIRQFLSYVQRTGTVRPTKHRQKPQEDFVKMRRRINIRDILWFRSPDTVAGRVLDASPVFQQKSMQDVEATAKKSLLSEWPKKLSSKFTSSSSSRMRTGSSTTDDIPLAQASAANGDGTQKSSHENDKPIPNQLRDHETNFQSGAAQRTFLNDDSAVMSADRDYELADALADPIRAYERRTSQRRTASSRILAADDTGNGAHPGTDPAHTGRKQ